MVDVLGDAKDAADVADGEHWAFVLAESGVGGAVLLPLGHDQADGDDGEVGGDVHAPGELVRDILARGKGAGFKQFVALAVGVAVLAGLELVVGLDGDADGAGVKREVSQRELRVGASKPS
jgi:hypothetical protein